jgi:hypothetical protein
MRNPTDVHNLDNQHPTIRVDTESKADRELDAFLGVVGTEVPIAQNFDCDCGCDGEFDFDDDEDL